MARRGETSKRLGRPRDGDSTETRERLLAVARVLFAQKGFDATTNRDIADGAAITTGAIYHYFSSKAELYLAACEEVFALVYTAFEKSVAGQDTLLNQFSAILDATVALNRDDPSVTGFVVSVATETESHPELAHLYEPLRGTNSRFLARLVTDAAERGELAPDVKPKAIEDLMNAMLIGLARFSHQVNDAQRHADAVDVMKRFLSGTLVRPPQHRPRARR